MEPRLVIAYALITLLAVAGAYLGWRWMTYDSRRRRKRRRNERTMRERWLRLPVAPDRP